MHLMYPSQKETKKDTRKGDELTWTVLKMAELPVGKEIGDEGVCSDAA